MFRAACRGGCKGAPLQLPRPVALRRRPPAAVVAAAAPARAAAVGGAAAATPAVGSFPPLCSRRLDLLIFGAAAALVGKVRRAAVRSDRAVRCALKAPPPLRFGCAAVEGT